MILPNFRLCLLIAGILSTLFYEVTAREIDSKTFNHKMALMDSLSFYRMEDYDTLYKIAVLDTSHGNEYKGEYHGWVGAWGVKSIKLVQVNGTERQIDRKTITSIIPLPVSQSTIDVFLSLSKHDKGFGFGNFGKHYLLNLWLYKKGAIDLSRQVLPVIDTLFSDGFIKNDFGILYYDAMLQSFSGSRDYQKATGYGSHLSKDIFRSYQYQKEAIALTAQLQANTSDFKTFQLPDFQAWVNLKQKLSRTEQIMFLAARLRLLNCIQPGQPADISYSMPQFSISFAEALTVDISYWDYHEKYAVVNPYAALLDMKLRPFELKLLLPYLLEDNYIPTYTYFRDFFADRTLHKLSWVVNSLIFETTNRRFFAQSNFDTLSRAQKEIEVKKIETWCENNTGLSQEEMTISVLKTADRWDDFHKALVTASLQKYDSLLPVIVARFNDFTESDWPDSQQGIMAKAMFELGNEQYVQVVKGWATDTTDAWVSLWTSLFLLKHDKNSYSPAMDQLESVLASCDGTYYYPHAMELLLNTGDKRTMRLAEKILDKEHFQFLIYWDYYLNFIKKLIALKSDYTFEFFNKRLSTFAPEEEQELKGNRGKTNTMLRSDFYVMAIDKLKADSTRYKVSGSLEERLKYKEELAKWFAAQYRLLKEDKPNELQLSPVPENAPVRFLDSPR